METILTNMLRHIAQQMPQLSLVDEDYGQLETQEDTYPVTFPCVLVGNFETDWTDLGYSGSQKGTAQVVVRLAVDCYDDTHIGSGTEERITERQLMAKQLYHALQMEIFADGMGPLSRIKSRDYSLAHGIKVYEQVYQMEYHEE